MSELHDNTTPAREGSFAVSKFGVISYFPIEKASGLSPFMALILKVVDGNIVAALDVRLESVRHETE